MSETFRAVYLACHGETAWTVTGQHTGRTDLAPTEPGERNTQRLGERLGGLRAKVFTSPSRRAMRTCELACFGSVAQIDGDLVEWDYGTYEGRLTVDILKEPPDWQLFRDGCPAGESPRQVAARADRVVSESIADSPLPDDTNGDDSMATITTKDGATIFYKDWGPKNSQPIVFHHGWPLSSDDWDAQMLFFLANGYRVVAHDRRGHGRSSQVATGHDMDHYASDASAVAEHLDLRNAIHIGHSTGGGEVARYVAKYGQPQARVAKAVLIASVPPLMVKTDKNPEGTPIEVFDGFRKTLAANRAQFFLELPSGPFYGFNRAGATPSQGIIQNWWRQGMMGSALAHYEGIKAFSETDQTDDLKAITVPILVMQGDDDQIVPYKDASLLQAKLLKHGTLKIYPGFSHGMMTTNADVINTDILAFIKGAAVKAA